MSKLDREMFDYFHKWLEIWNSVCLADHFCPRGDELNFKIAKQINDFLTEQLIADIPF